MFLRRDHQLEGSMRGAKIQVKVGLGLQSRRTLRHHGAIEEDIETDWTQLTLHFL